MKEFLKSKKFFMVSTGMILIFVSAILGGTADHFKTAIMSIAAMVSGYSVGQGIADKK